MKYIDLVVAEPVEAGVVNAVETCLVNAFGVPTRRRGPWLEPEGAHDDRRDQYSSTVLMQALAKELADDSLRLLGITGRDVFIPMLTFVFGQAQLGGKIALVSLARLRQEFYRMPEDPLICMERACKEALHELGHTFGMTHCANRGCAMSLSTTIQHVDLKTAGYCGSCATLLRESEGRFGARPWSGFRLEDDL